MDKGVCTGVKNAGSTAVQARQRKQRLSRNRRTYLSIADDNFHESYPQDSPEMCCHRLFIYSTCGHSRLAPKAIVTCQHACIPPNLTYSTTCTLIAHPYQSWKVGSLCPECNARRMRLLEQVEVTQVVRFDEWKWKVSYGMPAHGKDFWGRKAEEREEREAASLKQGKRRKQFSLRRKSRRREREGESSEEQQPQPER